VYSNKTCDETADAVAQNELARLRRDAAQRAAAAAQHQRAAASVAQATSYSAAPTPPAMGANGAAPPPAASEQLLRSLKVSWYLKVSTRSRRGVAATCVSRRALPSRCLTACIASVSSYCADILWLHTAGSRYVTVTLCQASYQSCSDRRRIKLQL